MMCACIAEERGIGRGSVHNSSLTQVLERSRRLSKDEIILKLGDGKVVAAEAVGSLSLVISDHIWIESKECYYVPSMGYALEMAAKLLNIASSKTVSPTPYEIWHDKPASYKYLFIGYPKETAGYYFYELSEQNIFVSRNAVFLEKGFSADSRRDEVLLEESSEVPQHENATSFEPSVRTDGVPVIRRSTRESRPPERYGFLGLTSQLDNDPRTYGETMSDIDSDKWLEAIKSEMDSMGSNQVWTLVDPPKGVRPIGCKWVYKRKLGPDSEVMAFKARLVAKGYTERPDVDFEETFSPVAMVKSIWILLAIAAWYDYEIWQMDVKTAFLNGFVEEEIYMDQLEGFTSVGEEHKVCPLQRIKLYKKHSPKTDEELKRMSDIPYASAIGSTQHAIQCTRPDVIQGDGEQT
ncbi:UNVERIFIED_CONTAM: Copia protein [Sesamum latifolium]|uniref:Copia protein n=1 Tax=Sesamum latifolium TaxID=2727402 RepID=A0AAW2UJS8_9LAMI